MKGETVKELVQRYDNNLYKCEIVVMEPEDWERISVALKAGIEWLGGEEEHVNVCDEYDADPECDEINDSFLRLACLRGAFRSALGGSP